MRLSIFSVADHYPARARSVDAFYGELLAQARLADALGFESFWLAEHHFHEYGIVANPAVFLSAVARETQRIRLGPAIVPLVFRNPALVAEDYAILDRLSGGRLMMGVGSGYLAHEFAAFDVRPEDKRAAFDAALELFERAWAGEAVSGEGARYAVRQASLNVLPSQRPGPPIYVAALTPGVSYFVGRQGRGLLSVPYATVERMEEIEGIVADYARGLAEADGAAPEDPALVTLHAHVAESDAACRREAADAFDRYVASRLYARRQTFDDILRSRLGLFGSVERVTGQIEELAASGVRHVILLCNFGGLEADAVKRSMRLFAEEVRPRLASTAPA